MSQLIPLVGSSQSLILFPVFFYKRTILRSSFNNMQNVARVALRYVTHSAVAK